MSGKYSEKLNHKFGGYRRKSLKRTNRKVSRRRSLRRPLQVKIPFMITEATKQQLRSIGYTDDDIYRMRPDAAQSILRLKELGYNNDEIRGMNPDIVQSILKLNDL